MVGNGVHQMGFSQSYASMQEKRVIHFTGCLGNGQGRGVGKLVVAADHKGVEGKLRVDIGFFKIRTVHRALCGRSGRRSRHFRDFLLHGFFLSDEFYFVFLAGKFGNGHKNRRLKFGIQIRNHLFAHGNDDLHYMIVTAVDCQWEQPGLKGNIRKFMFLPDVFENFAPFFFYQIHHLSPQCPKRAIYPIINNIPNQNCDQAEKSGYPLIIHILSTSCG